ncbi:MAG: hypothetical protein HY328_10695, partial [Chloroflexi bacterium]|nr:hypothetical protein [Chloroflexota bacterium]
MRPLKTIRLPLPLRSLRAQLLLWVALPVAIGLFALSLTELHSHEQAMQQLVQERADNLTRAAAALVAMRLDDDKDRLLQVAGQPALHHISDEGWAEALGELETSFSYGAAIFDATGRALARSTQADWVERQIAIDLARGATVGQSAMTTYSNDGEVVLLLAAPISGGQPDRVLIAAIPISALSLPETLAPLSLHSQATLVIHSADGLPLVQMGDGDQTTGPKVVSSQVAIPLTGWQLIFQESWEGMVPPILRFENVLFVVVAMAVVISLLSAYFGLSHIAQPLQKLDAAAKRVGWGDFDAIQEAVGGVQEIEDLRVALAGMADQLRRHQQELQGYIGAMTLGQEEERK